LLECFYEFLARVHFIEEGTIPIGAWMEARRLCRAVDPKNNLAPAGSGSRLLPMKTTTMTLTRKRQTVFPLEWCRRVGLEHGGPLNVFDLGEDGLLIRPVKPPSSEAVARLLSQPPAGPQSPKAAAAIVERALRKVRRA